MQLREVLRHCSRSGARSAIICATEDDILKQIPQIARELPFKAKKIGICRPQRALFDDMTVLENVFLYKNPILPAAKRWQREQFERLKNAIGFSVNPFAKVKDLPGEEKYIVELMRLLFMDLQVVVINYILSYLGYYEYTVFCNILSIFKERNVAVIILTNRWEDMVGICNDIILFNKSKGEYTLKDVNQLQDNPQKAIFELMGYENVEPAENFVKTLNAIYSVLSLFDMGKNLEEELLKLSEMARAEINCSSCIFYLRGDNQRLAPYHDGDKQGNRCLIKQERLAELVKDRAEIRFFPKGKYKLDDMFERPQRQVEMLVSTPIVVAPNPVGVMVLAFEKSFVMTEKQIMAVKMLSHSAADLIRTSRMFNSMALVQESNHRIKNNLQIILSLIYIQKRALRKRQDLSFSREEMDEILNELVGRIRIIANIHDMMTRETGGNGISLSELIEKIAKSYESENYCLEIDVEDGVISSENAAWIAMVLNEIVCNSRKHAFLGLEGGENRIWILGRRAGSGINLCVRDNGRGLPKDFDFESAQSTGMRLIRTISQQLKAEVEFESDDGTRAFLRVPGVLS